MEQVLLGETAVTFNPTSGESVEISPSKTAPTDSVSVDIRESDPSKNESSDMGGDMKKYLPYLLGGIALYLLVGKKLFK